METSQTFNLFFPLVVVLDFVGREKKEKDVKNEENDFFLRQDFHKISECFDKIQYKQALNQTALDIHINDILDQMKKSASSHDGLVIFILGMLYFSFHKLRALHFLLTQHFTIL